MYHVVGLAGKWSSRTLIPKEEGEIIAFVQVALRHEDDRTHHHSKAETQEKDWKQPVVDDLKALPRFACQSPSDDEDEKRHTELLGIDWWGQVHNRIASDMPVHNQEHAQALHPIDEVDMWTIHDSLLLRCQFSLGCVSRS